MDLALNNLQRLICHKTNQTKPNHVNIRIGKTCTDINRLQVIIVFNFFDKIKLDFFQAMSMTLLLYCCTTWNLKKQIKGKWELHNTATCCYEYISGSRTPQTSCCSAVYLLSHKASKLKKEDMFFNAGELRATS